MGINIDPMIRLIKIIELRFDKTFHVNYFYLVNYFYIFKLKKILLVTYPRIRTKRPVNSLEVITRSIIVTLYFMAAVEIHIILPTIPER